MRPFKQFSNNSNNKYLIFNTLHIYDVPKQLRFKMKDKCFIFEDLLLLFYKQPIIIQNR